MSRSPASLGERVGIMQGRLVPSANGRLDCAPGSRWREEFVTAAQLQLNHIELVAERRPDHANPLWSAAGRRELARVSARSGVMLASICLNETLEAPVAAIALDLAGRLRPVLAELPIGIVVLPLLEESDLRVIDSVAAAKAVRAIGAALEDREQRLVLELGVRAEAALDFLHLVGSPRVGVCYDLGNAVFAGFDPAADLRALGSTVWHLHAKDKDSSGRNVPLGTGDVDFPAVFRELATQQFDGLVTLETTRGEDPRATAAQHRAFLVAMTEEVECR